MDPKNNPAMIAGAPKKRSVKRSSSPKPAKRSASPKPAKRSASPKPAKRPASAKPAKRSASPKPAAKKRPASAPAAKAAKAKKGGALMEDLKSLAVPFAILLAKQGVENMYAKKTASAKAKATKKPASAKAAKKPASARRRTTMTGGCGGSCGAPMSGGAAMGSNSLAIKNNFSKIAADIDRFLSKY